jgi:hypothetical protein
MARWEQMSRRLFLKSTAIAGACAAAVTSGVGMLLEACGVQTGNGDKDAGHDLSAENHDSSVPADASVPLDQSTPLDQAATNDQSAPNDQSVPRDMNAGVDMANPDLAKPADLKMYGWLRPRAKPERTRFGRWLARRGAGVKIDLG